MDLFGKMPLIHSFSIALRHNKTMMCPAATTVGMNPNRFVSLEVEINKKFKFQLGDWECHT
jgi:hypothetical protein